MGYFNYIRRHSSVVHIGDIPMGDNHPIRIQSMANVSTMDTEAAVGQAIRMVEAGAEYVRFTAQGEREARNLGVIRQLLTKAGCNSPLIADIHFNPKAAEVAAKEVEKVRINPGNYAPDYERIKERFIPFLQLCKKQKTAIRIGVNHGSLSERIMNQYGDTPAGMVASCMEFLFLCREEKFDDVVISMKASNTVVMVEAVRLLVKTLEKEEMHYPLHLGVTEAGDGEDGRIKSAVGIGALLSDGLGDTIRVSLSEEPEAEIPVAQKLVNYISKREGHEPIDAVISEDYNPTSPQRRISSQVRNIGGGQVPIVISDYSERSFIIEDSLSPSDYLYIGTQNHHSFPKDSQLIVDANVWKEQSNCHPCFLSSEQKEWSRSHTPIKFVRLHAEELNTPVLTSLCDDPAIVILLDNHHPNWIGMQRAAMHRLIQAGYKGPVVFYKEYHDIDIEALQVKSASDFGTLLLDGFGDGLMLRNREITPQILNNITLGILQATRLRISKTEFISCPGCGRTLFDLQSTIARVKKETSHLKGLKIGIMGCIVNGPGEMADANYGYVGAGSGLINLYKGRDCVKKNIPEKEAVAHLIALIKENGDWQER